MSYSWLGQAARREKRVHGTRRSAECTQLAAIVLIVLTVASSAGGAQAVSPRTPRSAAPGLVEFFAGKWNCEGTFANGKPIASSMEFREILDGAWLSANHDDVAPNRYHAMALWGAAAGTGIVAHIADNGGGMRRFVATDGWKDDRLMLARDTTLATARFTGRFAERFTYARESPTTFRMTYETARDTVSWHMGDTLLCTRA